ncbi:MAG TPA: ABC transporter permease [Conexibacter sp.]|jgi:ABC-type nitrate/sulfonate/bicarbonate transport system permease component
MSAGTAQPAAISTASRRPRLRVPGAVQGLLAVIALLALLELVTAVGLLPERHFPLVSNDLKTLFDQLSESSFWSAVGETLHAWAIGFAIAAVLGIVLGILIGASEELFAATRVVIEFLRPIPSVALIPLAVLVYGTGIKSAVFLAAFAALWPILVQAIYGVRDVDPVALDTARAFGFGRFQRMRYVMFPSAVAYVVTGLRIASSTAIILVVTAELVIGAPGLGKEINLAQSGNDLELMYALIIATGLLGWALNVAFTWIERRTLHWHPSQRPTEGS